MRIGIVALSCPNGGMLHYTSQLANALSERTEVHLFTPMKKELASYLDGKIFLHPTIPLSVPGEGKRNLLRQLNPISHIRNARTIRKQDVDVVHFVTEHPSNSLLIPLLGDTPICFTHHDPVRHLGESSYLRDFLNHRTARMSHRIVAHGEALRTALIQQKLAPERIVVCPHGDYGFLKKLARRELAEETILCFGRMVPYKGIDVLCRAEKLLRQRLNAFEILIAGEGETGFFRSEIEPASRIEVINRFLPDEEVADLFQRARLIVLPYTEASQSGILAIAFAFGKPVVVTDVGGLPEAVGFGQAGLIVPPNDPPALAEAIERLWIDPELRARLGNAGKSLIEETIGWPHIAESHASMYREISTQRSLL